MNAEEIPATPGQRVLWLMDHYRGGNGMMSVPLLYRMHGALDVAALRTALARLTTRHEALRTTVHWRQRRLTQRLHPDLTVDLELIDVPGGELELGDLVRSLLRRPLDTAHAVFRTALLQLAPDDHLLVLDIHHLVTDAWSNTLISRDLAAYYNEQLGAASPALPSVRWQYSDYTRWQQDRLSGDRLDYHKNYWNDRMPNAKTPKLPPVPERAGRTRPLAANEWFTLPPAVLNGLREVAREERTTRFVLLFAVFFMTMHAVASQSDLTIGSIFANRTRQETHETAGFFANLVPVRAEVGPVSDPRAVIRNVRRAVLEAMEHEEFPYLTMPAVPGAGHENRPDDVVFHMLAVPPSAHTVSGEFTGLSTQPLHIPDGLGSRFDLELLVLPRPAGPEAVVRYAADRFNQGYIKDLVSGYQQLAAHIAAL